MWQKNKNFLTGYVYDERALAHYNMGHKIEEHPEVPERIERIYYKLSKKGYIDRMIHIPSRPALDHELLYAHSSEYLETMKKTKTMKKTELFKFLDDLDSVYMNNYSESVSRLSCGGAINLCKSVWRGDIQNGVAIIRPPGHHAERDRARGFCVYNNCAVAARCLQREENAKRIMILDWDIHHGNGIQDIFYDDPDILYISVHRYDNLNFYPFSPKANLTAVGSSNAKGRNINIPWPCMGMGDTEYICAFNRIIMPIAYEFSPEMVIVAAGFDASKNDTLGMCKVSNTGFAHMTHLLKVLSGGKLALILEGGYNVEVTANALTACVGILLNEPPPPIHIGTPMDAAFEAIQDVIKIQSHYWNSLAPVYMDPHQEIKIRNEYSKISFTELIKSFRRSHVLSEYNLIHLPIFDDSLLESFKGDIIASPQVMSHEGFVFLFIHDGVDARVEMNAYENLAELNHSYIFDFGLSYIKDIILPNSEVFSNRLSDELLRKKANALIEVIIDFYEIEKNARSSAVDGVLRYIWDNYINLSKAGNKGRVIIIATGNGVANISSLIADRDVEKSVLCTVLFPWLEGPPHIILRKSDWYFNSSLVVVPHELPPKTIIPTTAQYGRCVSCGNDIIDSKEAPIKFQKFVIDFINKKKSDYWIKNKEEYKNYIQAERLIENGSSMLLLETMGISSLDQTFDNGINEIDLENNEIKNKRIKISSNQHRSVSNSDQILKDNDVEEIKIKENTTKEHSNNNKKRKSSYLNSSTSKKISKNDEKQEESKINVTRTKVLNIEAKPYVIEDEDKPAKEQYIVSEPLELKKPSENKPKSLPNKISKPAKEQNIVSEPLELIESSENEPKPLPNKTSKSAKSKSENSSKPNYKSTPRRKRSSRPALHSDSESSNDSNTDSDVNIKFESKSKSSSENENEFSSKLTASNDSNTKINIDDNNKPDTKMNVSQEPEELNKSSKPIPNQPEIIQMDVLPSVPEPSKQLISKPRISLFDNDISIIPSKIQSSQSSNNPVVNKAVQKPSSLMQFYPKANESSSSTKNIPSTSITPISSIPASQQTTEELIRTLKAQLSSGISTPYIERSKNPQNNVVLTKRGIPAKKRGPKPKPKSTPTSTSTPTPIPIPIPIPTPTPISTPTPIPTPTPISTPTPTSMSMMLQPTNNYSFMLQRNFQPINEVAEAIKKYTRNLSSRFK